MRDRKISREDVFPLRFYTNSKNIKSQKLNLHHVKSVIIFGGNGTLAQQNKNFF